MTSIVKKVLRSSGKKKRNNHGSEKGRRSSVPENPPSPDLTGLNPEELAILKDVLRRQEELESEEVDRQQRLREHLVTYEDEVKKHASQKSKFKNVDLRLCRLCYKTKFADGIGKACYDCHKRVCNKCGSFSQSTWNAKKNKSVRGKWRCNMCQMKRDVVAKTGVWYHGNEGPEITSNKFKTKLSASEIDSSENDGQHHISTTDPTPENEERDESDVFSEGSPGSSRIKATKRPSKSCLRRRSTSQSEMDDVDDGVDDEINIEQFQKERQISRMQRHSKRSRRRLWSGSMSDWSSKDGYTDTEKKVDASSSDAVAYETGSTDYYQSTDQDRFTSSDRSPDRKERSPRCPKRTPKSSSLQENWRVTEDGSGKPVSRALFRQKHSFEEDYRDKYHPRGSIREEPCSFKLDRRDVSSHYEKIVCSRSNSAESSRNRRQKHPALREQQSNDRMPIIEISKNQNEIVPSITSSKENLYKRTRPSGFQRENIEREHGDPRESRYSCDSRISRDSVSSHDSRVLRESRFSRDSCTSFDSVDTSPVPISGGVRRKLERQNETCYSSSSSIFSDSKPYQTYDTARFELSDTSPSKVQSVHEEVERQNIAQKLPRSANKGLTANRLSSNSLSPDMALHRSHREKVSRRNDAFLQRAGSASPKMSSDHEYSGSPGNDIIRDTYNRRMTLPHCINIDIPQRKRPDSHSTSRVHEIIIHRNKRDDSVRTQGLGMRVVGGRRVSGGRLCAYVTMVIKGGPADRQGISEGDQVVEWNGRSLLDVTFEEAQEIISQSGSIVQLSIIHGALKTGSTQSLRRDHPIIIKSETLPTVQSLPLETYFLGRPKRRMLPKTPVEIKRDVKKINGRLWIQLDYDVNCNCLLVVLLRGEDILSETQVEGREPNTLAMLHLLPNRHAHEAKESDIKLNTKDPNWNETFVFANIEQSEITSLSIEVTVWNYRDPEDEFLGEVLLDLGEAKIDNSVNCYHLEDHDENSSPLPYRKKSFSLSDSAVSPATSVDTSSFYPSRDPSREPSPRSSVSVATKETNIRKLSLTPANEKIKELLVQGKRSPCRERPEFSSSAHSSPLHSPTSTEFKMTSSLTSLVRRKIGVVARLSSTLASLKRESDHGAAMVRSQSDTDVRDSNLLQPCSTPQQPRRSFECDPKRYDLLAPPHPLNISSSSGNTFFDDRDSTKSPNPDRPAPEGDDITSLLGPGQTAPKPSYETNVCGDIKMGFMVSKGQLEIDIVVVKGLMKSGISSPPDTYVKTYLVEGAKTVQKKKTQTIRMSFDPIFRKTIRYSACNIHGRYIRVNVWEKQKTFDRKQCLGEAVVKLDSLDLSQHTMAWYKLFPLGAAEIGSTESLNFWPVH
ncbi:regulating synaptic membrane exocytosis protein 2-like [Mercenaria mercenaria]|uniref:regulating synaptic membrane exocytosis protein 2-like n=1 Tax=Mercenaria mercenaria TaxID=6596 RepID=UPI00234E70C1|nr:regulating synaptic membrane exocytosis protein 2-like [Mercenaria mercenaria]XP_053395166.1 regulating synaptic membrane exocytosis protein 2-like [Mercenaria mercenaria]